MTALVASDLYGLDEEIKVPNFCTTVEGSKAGFSEGETVKVEDLLRALLISSSGDAACTLATGKISYSDFVEKMNNKASEIGMNSTSFTNPVGLDGTDGLNYSTAKDLYLLSRKAMSNELIKNTVNNKEIEIGKRKITSTNKLLWEIPETIGIKTGTTAAAGEVLIYEYADRIKNIEIIVMGSADRFADTKTLLTWTLQSFVWE
jgi:D-alanyl-D-alanine carboxypeptidase